MTIACDNGHPEATHRCIACGAHWCEDCIVPLEEMSRVFKCATCSDMAVRMPDRTRLDAGLLAEIPAAFVAPFRAPASWVFAIGGGLLCGAFSFYWIHPAACALATATVAMYFNSYAASIANITAQGLAEDPFGWDVSDDMFGILFFPSARSLALCVVGAGSMVAAHQLGKWPLIVVATAVMLWLPAAWLRIAQTERLLDAFAPSTLRAVAAAGPYEVLTLLFYGLVSLPLIAVWTIAHPATILGAPVMGYSFIVGGRLLGLLYFHNAERIDWFGESTRHYTPVR